MWFDLGRSEGFPTQYVALQTAVTVDVLEAGFVTAFFILLIAFFVSLPTSKFLRTICSLTQVSITLLIGLFLLLENFGQEWEVGHITSKTSYKAGSSHEINASMSVKIGLRSVNITLKSNTSGLNNQLKNEMIDYNERFEWTWDQGNFGFGPYAGHLQQQFRAAQYRGVPLPIIWIADYFVIDGEGFRHGRFYRTAGWYSHIILWTAFATWLLTVILFRCPYIIKYGVSCLAITGILQLSANLVWLVVRNPNPLVIPFEDATIRTKFGASYWFTFVNGVVCLSLALTMFIMQKYCITYLYDYLGYDSTEEQFEFIYGVNDLTPEEKKFQRPKGEKNNSVEMEHLVTPGTSADNSYTEERNKPIYARKSTFKSSPSIKRELKPDRKPLVPTEAREAINAPVVNRGVKPKLPAV